MGYHYDVLRRLDTSIVMSKQALLDELAKEGIKKFKEYVQEYWYDAYSPSDYDRTMQFLNSVSVRFEGDTVILYYDASGVYSAYRNFGGSGFDNNGHWNVYMDTFEPTAGQPFDAATAFNYFENTGMTVLTKDHAVHRAPAHAIRRTRGWLANYVTRAAQMVFGVKVKTAFR